MKKQKLQHNSQDFNLSPLKILNANVIEKS